MDGACQARFVVCLGRAVALLSRRGYTRKKSPHTPKSRRPDVLILREAWFEEQTDVDHACVVFIDESWANTNMARRYGRCPRGERLRMSVPHGHWKMTTLIAGMTLDGIVAISSSIARSIGMSSRPGPSGCSSQSCAGATP